ncbi:MAG: Nif3-like dinuclear metal center hexameric protein [Clostridiales Family XIII bacterium]|jgi:dinuclear metal center YbgI/SA1388 family protein|nr:Nif3-like dinuclear metal center hexameric protein [Clostridiales Family XIII bacterium]
MTVQKHELIRAIESAFPLCIQEAWDNSGWQIDLMRPDESVGRVLVTLDTTRETVREAEEAGVDLIVEHHPLFFVHPTRIDASGAAPDPAGEYAAALIKAGVSVYAAHTTFDTAEGGMNDALAQALGLTDVEGFPIPCAGSDGKWSHAMGRKGTAPEEFRTFSGFCSKAEELFDMKGRLKTVGAPDAAVRTVALCGGAGGDFVIDAIREGVDLYITADVKHHEARWANERGLLLIDGGHHGTEKIFVRVMAGFLRDTFAGRLEVIGSQTSRDPWA